MATKKTNAKKTVSKKTTGKTAPVAEKKKRNVEPIEYKEVSVGATLPDGTEIDVPMFQVEFAGEIFQAKSKSECRKWITGQKALGSNFPKVTNKIVDIEKKLSELINLDDSLVHEIQKNTLLISLNNVSAVIEDRIAIIDCEPEAEPETETE